MFRKFKLATIIAVAISAGSTIGSVYAGGHGSSGHSGHSHSSSNGGGGFKIGGSNGGNMPRINQSSSSNVIRTSGIKLGSSGNSGIAGGIKTLPKNTGIVPPVVKIGGANNSNKQVLGKSISTMDVIKGTNALKNFGDKVKSGGLGIAIGEPHPHKPGNGNGNGGGNGNGNHHHSHHHCPPLVFTLPVCQPTYHQPCPPIYYPQPYPVAVPVPVDANGNPIDPNAVGPAAPAAPPMGLPMETKKALQDTIATQAPPADTTAQPDNAVKLAAATEVVSNEVSLPQIPVGATLTLNGKDLSDKEGQVVLQVGEIALPATITEWKNDMVTCTLPVLGLTKPSKATLHILKADGKTASTLNCELVTTVTTSVAAKTTSGIEAAKYEQ